MSNIDHYNNFISDQVRKERALGLRTLPIEEATEKTAVKNELKNLGQHLGGDVEGSHRTGRGNQMTTPSIDTSHHSKEKVVKTLQSAGYKKVRSDRFGDAIFHKTDKHGFTHSVKHGIDGNNHSVHHLGTTNL